MARERSTQSDTWPDLSKDYRNQFDRRRQTGSMADTDWGVHEPWYRYGHEMAESEDYRDREWEDIEDDLRTGYPAWARSRGYDYENDETLWGRFKASVREAWDSVTGKRKR